MHSEYYLLIISIKIEQLRELNFIFWVLFYEIMIKMNKNKILNISKEEEEKK